MSDRCCATTTFLSVFNVEITDGLYPCHLYNEQRDCISDEKCHWVDETALCVQDRLPFHLKVVNQTREHELRAGKPFVDGRSTAPLFVLPPVVLMDLVWHDR